MKRILEHSRKPDVAFFPNGKIEIGARAARLLSLSRGDVIDLAAGRDGLYLYVRHRAPLTGRWEAAVFPSSRRGSHFRTWSVSLCAAVLSECGADGTVRLCAGEPVEDITFGRMLPLITRLAL